MQLLPLLQEQLTDTKCCPSAGLQKLANEKQNGCKGSRALKGQKLKRLHEESAADKEGPRLKLWRQK